MEIKLGSKDKDRVKTIKVGLGSCGIAAGAQGVFDYFNEKIKGMKIDVNIEPTGCMGMCYNEVLVEIEDSKEGSALYKEVTREKAEKIFNEHVLKGHPVKEYIVDINKENTGEGFFSKQKKIVLRNCGVINPESIDDYISSGGYKALEKVLKSYSPEKVIEEVIKSGLKGRGGAGFLSGKKWELCRNTSSELTVQSSENSQQDTNSELPTKYMICNGDEGDPGAFMDRGVLESDPHSVIEGMTIAAYAIGASHGYIYCRAEYPLAIQRLRIALDQAKRCNFIGKEILGTRISFDIKIKEGAGAFVCGEETALIASIEGYRGMPRFRPPYPAKQGLWKKPTVINNVETLANVPWIILNGADRFSALGTQGSKGTKVFALAGKIKRGGLVEVPMGLTLDEVVNVVGGGTSTGKKLKAIQIGGPSGGCLPASLFDVKIDYESLNATGAIMGSGGLVVMDEASCMVDIAKFFLNFVQNESCGKCTFCRVGTKRMLEILTRITDGLATEKDLPLLEELAQQVKLNSLCGLGQTAPNPVLTTLKYFREEYEAHILKKKCLAGKCKKLITYGIAAEKCKNCGACAKVCSVKAISGSKKEVYKIDTEKCIRCGLCVEVCKFDSIKVE